MVATRQKKYSMARVWPMIIGNIDPDDVDKFRSKQKGSDSESESKSTSQGVGSLKLSQQGLLPTLEKLRGFLPPQLEKQLDTTFDMTETETETETCDNRCTNAADCLAKSTSSCPYQPMCKVNLNSQTQTVGGSLAKLPLAFAAYLCLPKNTRLRLGNRDIMEGEEEEKEEEDGQQRMMMDMEKWPCACNASYVSHACCESETGQI
jgi:hypothetical protein